MTARKKLAGAVVVLAVVTLALLAWRSRIGNHDHGSQIKLSGNVEVTEVNIAFKAPGRLKVLRVKEGDYVKQGELLAALDDEELRHRRDSAAAAVESADARLRQLATAILYQREAAESNISRAAAELRQAEAVLAQLLAGSRSQEIGQAEARAAAAATELKLARADWERAQRLYKNEDISTAQYDQFRSRFAAAEAVHHQATEQLALVKEGPRQEDIEGARAVVARGKAALRLAEAGRMEVTRLEQELEARRADREQARAQREVLETQLRDTQVTAPVDGVVLVKAAEEGEILAAGTAVLKLGDLDRPWIRAYLGEQHLGRVKLGDEARVLTDSRPGRAYAGRISYISGEAEFTPKQIQTQEERVKLVYRIKIEVNEANRELKPNMPADAMLSLGPA